MTAREQLETQKKEKTNSIKDQETKPKKIILDDNIIINQEIEDSDPNSSQMLDKLSEQEQNARRNTEEQKDTIIPPKNQFQFITPPNQKTDKNIAEPPKPKLKPEYDVDVLLKTNYSELTRELDEEEDEQLRYGHMPKYL